jgi:putative transposase
MAGLHRSYACYHHRVYQTAGFLWQGRFKVQPVEKENYLVTCGRYIERNPVRADLVKEAFEYPYSSAAYYCLGHDDGLAQESPLFISFGNDIESRRAHYSDFLRNFNQEEERCFKDLSNPQGSKEFLRRLAFANGRYLPKRRGRPRPPKRIVS